MNSIPLISDYCQEASSYFLPMPIAPPQPAGQPETDCLGYSEVIAESDSVQIPAEEPEPEIPCCSALPTALFVEIDGRQHTFALADLSVPTFFVDLQSHCQQATTPVLFIAHDLFGWPDESRFLLLKLIRDLGSQARLQLDDDTQERAGPFETIMAHLVGYADLQRCGMGQRAIIEAAALFLSADIWPLAASQIVGKLKDLGVKGVLPQSILKSIQNTAEESGNVKQADPTALAEEFLRRHRELLFRERETTEEGMENTETSAEEPCPDDLPALEDDSLLQTTPVLRYFQDDYYVWQGKCWEKVIGKEFETGMTRFLQRQADLTVTKTLVGNVVANLQGLTLLPGWLKSPPFWVESENPLRTDTPRLINLANGMLDLNEALSNSSPACYPHDPRHFSTVELPYAFDPAASCPLWEQTLLEILPLMDVAANDRRIEVLQEFMGWSLFARDTQFEVFLILVGRGANGKSTLLKVVESLLGSANVSHVPLEGFSSEFRLYDMAGKLANIAGDMQRMEKIEEGVLKQLISGERLQVNRKNKDPVTMDPTAKLIFATNELPPINDRSDGIWRRMIAVPFSVQFPLGQRDTQRAQKLIDELPGIFNWALNGARRLYQQGGFTVCPTCMACVDEHRVHSDPILQFIEEKTTRNANASILSEVLYSEYTRFCETNRRKPYNSREFGRRILELSGVTRQRLSIPPRSYEYKGIGLCSISYPQETSPRRQQRAFTTVNY